MKVLHGSALAAVLLGSLSGGAALASEPTPYSEQALARKDYRGVRLQILTPEQPRIGEPTELHARTFERLTGAQISVRSTPFDNLYQEVLLGLKQRKYDIVYYSSMWIADLQPYLAPLPEEMLRSPQYQDVLSHYKSVARWGDVAYQVPIDGDRHYLQYRRDLLESPEHRAAFRERTGRALAVPRTWPELQEVARFFQGRKQADGRTVGGLVEVTAHYATLGIQFIKRAAPYAKHPRVKGGFYFELQNMEPLINTPGFVEALNDFVAARDLHPPGGREQTLAQVIQAFGNGEAVFSDSWDAPFVQAMEPGSPTRNKVSIALSPGARRVWNRRSGSWDDFPEVSYAPYVAYGSTAAVARESAQRQAAFDFLGFFANAENHAADLLVGRFGINPFRHTDLNRGFWVKQAGWDQAVAESYVQMLERMDQSHNRILDLRIHRGQDYVHVLSVGVYRALTGRESPQSALDTVAARWRELTARVGVEKQREAYRHVVLFEDGQEDPR
jgi:multiple sugar transport system substrate-binding protein